MGTKGEFKWSSQHLDGGVCDGHAETVFARPHLVRGSLVVLFDGSVAIKELGGYYFVCRPEKAALPKVEAFRCWIAQAATEATVGDEIETEMPEIGTVDLSDAVTRLE